MKLFENVLWSDETIVPLHPVDIDVDGDTIRLSPRRPGLVQYTGEVLMSIYEVLALVDAFDPEVVAAARRLRRGLEADE